MTFSEFASFLGYVSSIALVTGLVIGFLFYRNLNKLHKSILFYMLLMFGIDATSRAFRYYSHPNVIIIPIFSFIELLSFIYIYNKHLLVKKSKIIIGLGLLGLVYIVAEFLQYFVFNTLDLKQFQPYCKIADNFNIIIMALVFYYQKMNSFNETKWNNFRLNTAVLIYFTINTIIYIPFNFIINETIGVRLYIWVVNIVIVLLFYSYLTVLIWKNGRRAITKS